MPPAGPLRVLLVSEGGLGGATLGHLAIEDAFRRGFAGFDDIDLRILRLPEMLRQVAVLTAALPVLHERDLDLQVARWHAVQAIRTRRLVRRALARGPTPGVLIVNSHTIAFALRGAMRRVPTLLCVDVCVDDWQRLRLGSRGRPWSDVAMAPSRHAERRAFEGAATVVAISEWTAAAVRRSARAVLVEVTHPGVDTSVFQPGPRGKGPLRLLFVGGRFREKGGHDLLEAVAPWLGRSVVVDVVTTATVVPQRAGVRIHRLANPDPALVRLFQEADLLCLPTSVDAVPLVVPEALACGTPVLVSTVGALPDLASRAGIVVPPGNPLAIREALRPFVSDRTPLQAMRVAARADAEERFDVRRQAHRLADLVRRVAAAAPAER